MIKTITQLTHGSSLNKVLMVKNMNIEIWFLPFNKRYIYYLTLVADKL